jgi:hypothetical protein
VVIFVAVRAFKGADIWVADECIRALAGHTLSPLHGKALQTGFAFYEPDQNHLSTNLKHKIFQFLQFVAEDRIQTQYIGAFLNSPERRQYSAFRRKNRHEN